MERALLTLAAVLLGLIVVSTWLVLYQLIKQQGRMLLRLDGVEHKLAHGGASMPALATSVMPTQPAGLPEGTPITPFRLPDLMGRMVAWEDFRGQRVLLVHWNPKCGFCDLIASDLAGLQADLRKRNAQLLLVSYGDVEANHTLAEEHGLNCPILLQQDSRTLEVFQRMGTPAAYFLDQRGQVAHPVAVGAERVLALARDVAANRPESDPRRLPGNRPLTQSRIERNGLKAGALAPSFHLPDVYGRMVSLDMYRGRRVLLIFTDPHCGPCDQLTPHLVRLHRRHRDNGLALVMVGRGAAEENRRKVEEHGVEFPVVLQEGWRLSKEYGIFATPVAFLIGEDGVIARNVATGVDQVLTLTR